MAASTLRKSRSALGALLSKRCLAERGLGGRVCHARKLAQLVYRLVRYGQAYIDTGAQAYEDRVNHRRLKFYSKILKAMGYNVETCCIR